MMHISFPRLKIKATNAEAEDAQEDARKAAFGSVSFSLSTLR